MNSILHYFISSNVPRSVSYYESNFGPLSQTIRLSGYPHHTLEAVFSAVCARAQEEDTPLHIIHNCLDNTIQGIILPEHSAGAYGFDIFDTDERNVLSSTNAEKIAEIKNNFATAREQYASARYLHDDQEKIYIGNMDFDAVNRLTEDTIHLLLDDKISDHPGSEVHRFFGAATIHGNINYIPEVTRDIQKRYLIKGRPGTGKSTFLKKIASAAKQQGFHVEIYHCSLDPNSLDLVAVRELGFCLFDSTAPHEYFPSRPSDEIIDIYQRCVTPGTDEKYAEELSKLQTAYKEILRGAAGYLKNAKQAMDEFDASLPPYKEGAIEEITSAVLQKLF